MIFLCDESSDEFHNGNVLYDLEHLISKEWTKGASLTDDEAKEIGTRRFRGLLKTQLEDLRNLISWSASLVLGLSDHFTAIEMKRDADKHPELSDDTSVARRSAVVSLSLSSYFMRRRWNRSRERPRSERVVAPNVVVWSSY